MINEVVSSDVSRFVSKLLILDAILPCRYSPNKRWHIDTVMKVLRLVSSISSLSFRSKNCGNANIEYMNIT